MVELRPVGHIALILHQDVGSDERAGEAIADAQQRLLVADREVGMRVLRQRGRLDEGDFREDRGGASGGGGGISSVGEETAADGLDDLSPLRCRVSGRTPVAAREAGGRAVESGSDGRNASCSVGAQDRGQRVGMRVEGVSVPRRVPRLRGIIKDTDDIGGYRDADPRVPAGSARLDRGVIPELQFGRRADAAGVQRAVEQFGMFAGLQVVGESVLRVTGIVDELVAGPAGERVAGPEITTGDDLEAEGIVDFPVCVGVIRPPVGIGVLEAAGLIEAVDERGGLFPVDHADLLSGGVDGGAGEDPQFSRLQSELGREVDAEHILVVRVRALLAVELAQRHVEDESRTGSVTRVACVTEDPGLPVREVECRIPCVAVRRGGGILPGHRDVVRIVDDHDRREVEPYIRASAHVVLDIEAEDEARALDIGRDGGVDRAGDGAIVGRPARRAARRAATRRAADAHLHHAWQGCVGIAVVDVGVARGGEVAGEGVGVDGDLIADVVRIGDGRLARVHGARVRE